MKLKTKLITLSALLVLSTATTIILFNTVFSNKGDPIVIENLAGEYDYTKTAAVFHNDNLNSPAPVVDTNQQILGVNNSDKRIEVDLAKQRLYAYEGDKKVYDFLVSTGKWGKTPTGEFTIWSKLRYTKMSGGSQALHTYYYLPNVPYVMFFYNEDISKAKGFSLHGTYWHSNFGHTMSHGCVNMKTEEAKLIYYWANPILEDNKKSTYASKDNEGTKIIIYGEAPKN